MKIGTYFAYWEKEWDTDFFPYISKVARLGFDILEIAGGGLADLPDDQVIRLRDEASRCNITLTVCIGLPAQYDVSSENEETRQAGIAYMKRLIDKTNLVGARQIGGIVYAYWPVDYSKPVNKAATREISIRSIQELADYALPKDVTLTLETVNRFEQFLFNDAAEATQFVKDVNRDNVKVMLDSFHMNIEEDSFYDAIVSTGSHLGHFHIGEPNRKVPGKGRIPWDEIGRALRDIGYDGTVVMEPFVRPGGGVGADIKVWRDLSDNASDEKMDEDIAESCRFVRKAFCG
ncbi:MAG: sugar phosphate isomerase/epimerase [Lachnospiraceae bacterium]|jgi:D-psicose/D-tagatose/L-ribulose 3-epimerase|nr:sugar phosphate isomerase/epimerase [Lachnospiraceae bacterium]MCI9622617.1 sugar phosphate isomerase/epimerase [Lachnospiraceae bacterium]